MKTWYYALFVFLGGCSFGILSTFVKLAYSAGFSMAEVTGSQVLFGTLIIWVLTLFTKKVRVSPLQVTKILLGGFPMGLTGILYYHSLETLNASLAIIFLFQFIWIGTLLEWGILKKKPSIVKVISIIILLTGSLLGAGIFTDGLQSMTWQGAAWGMLAATSFSTFLMISSLVEKQVPPIQRSAILSSGAMIVTFLLFPPLFLMDGTTLVGITPFGIILGVFGVVLPPLLFSIGMPHIGPGLGSILTASELPVALFMSAIVLSETVDWIQWAGVILILIGILFSNLHPFSINKEFKKQKE
ncbi:EamA family transporter [Peribacillus alkalitolerans]|uniref:EamA family transporter n=1 Tax=Peribacillus alkalitolerans TaxID=1550385 RepID=UPI0013D87D0F|nr:DMT family transporter [Peribacillus alkalitolerans]